MPPSSLIRLQLGGKNENRGLNIEELLAQISKILIPINWNQNHWILAILSIEKKEVLILDSLESYTRSVGRQNIFSVSSALIFSKFWLHLIKCRPSRRKYLYQVNGGFKRRTGYRNKRTILIAASIAANL